MRSFLVACPMLFVASISVALAQPRIATFSEPRQFPAGTEPITAVIADFNHDGKPDVAVADESNGNISILLNNGNGFAASEACSTGTKATSIAAADFNHDGNPDLAVIGDAPYVYIHFKWRRQARPGPAGRGQRR